MARNDASDALGADSSENAVIGQTGILTKTVIRSPVINWILHARIRNRICNDVVFVGNDFIQVKQVKDQGSLQHIATKDDFDTRIRAAKAFSIRTDLPDEELFIKVENGGLSNGGTQVPPQCLVLTLESNDIVFIYLASDDDGGFRFVQQTCPLPVFDRTLFQPGEHLAVDPQSRALAVAANEREIVIYSAKAKARIQREVKRGDQDWCPVSAQRPLQVEGVIQQMDFLIPPTNSHGADDEDHIILLLIVVSERRTRAIWIEWYCSSDLHHAQIHPGQPLDASKSVPSLLIPLRNASFLLVHGSEIKRWRGILSGSATSVTLQPLAVEPSSPGAAPRRPVWTNWCRPRRGGAARSDIDHLYLIREDGQVYLVQIFGDKVETSHAGDFECHVGTAFASLGDPRDPDILAVAGDMSNGRVQSIGSWFTPLKIQDISRGDALEMEWIETIPNWASVTDLATSTLPGKSERSRDGIFVTSGRQPYGAITELRRGLEARLVVYFELEGLRSVTDVWALPFAAVGHILLILSSPAGTRLLDIPAEAEMESIEELDDTSTGLDSAHRTLAAATALDGKIIQITEKSICITPGSSLNFEDCARIDHVNGSANLAATIDVERSIAVVAERSSNGNMEYALVCYALRTDDSHASGEAQIVRVAAFGLDSEPLCLALLPATTQTQIVVATAADQLCAFVFDQQGAITPLAQHSIPTAWDDYNACDSIVILKSEQNSDPSGAKLLCVCGLRDGWLYPVVLNPHDEALFGKGPFVRFGKTTAKVEQPAGKNTIAYAMSGLDTCLLSWDGHDAHSLSRSMQSIWVSDKLRPELSQGPVAACTHMPAAHLLSSPELADSLIMISGNELLITNLERKPTTVPRQIPVSGTPNRLIYLEKHRCLVSASIRYDVRTFPSSIPHAKPQERRQIWPVLDFVPSRSSSSSFAYDMQPGERIYALLEWSFKASEDKTYSFLLVGGSYTKSSGVQRGRITFLQPVNKNWEIVDVKEGRSTSFDAPVYALALHSENIIVVCAGSYVHVLRFAAEERKWKHICTPIRLASAGVYLSVAFERIYVSTAEDSLFLLQLTEANRDDIDRDDYDMQLIVLSIGPRADTLICHTLPFAIEFGKPKDGPVALMSTKYGQVLGLDTWHRLKDRHANSTELLFEAQLPRSLTRLRLCNTRPQWRAEVFSGIYSAAHVVGCAADGSIVGMAFLTDQWWRRLSWLQRLCEWSAELSPHSYQYPPYSVGEGIYARDERAMPIGLSGSRHDEIAMRTSKPKLQDGHIDGDVLARLLMSSRTEALKDMISEVAERHDRAGTWVKAHLEEELNAVDEVLEIVRDALNLWL